MCLTGMGGFVCLTGLGGLCASLAWGGGLYASLAWGVCVPHWHGGGFVCLTGLGGFLSTFPLHYPLVFYYVSAVPRCSVSFG